MFVRKKARSLLTDYARQVGFLWGVAEATVFFVLPDFFLAPAIITKPKQAWRLVISITLGSTVGALLMSLFIVIAPAVMRDVIVSVPFTNEAMITLASQYTSQPLASFGQSISGVPMKVWLWTMITGGASFIVFFGFMMAGRLGRFLLVALVALCVEKWWGGCIRRHASLFFVVYIVVFFGFLALVANRA